MLTAALVFFLISSVAAALGLGGVAVGTAAIGKILFLVFLTLATISVVANAAADPK